MKSWRRYEILLPLRVNTGKAVSKVLLAETLQELEFRFGAASCETQVILGRWRSGPRSQRDDLIRVYVDARPDAEVQALFADFKQRLKARLRQLDIWLTSHEINML